MDIAIKSWSELTRDEFFLIAQLRCEVFFVEQRVNEQDFDDADRAEATSHIFINDDTGCAAYLRVLDLPEPQHGAIRSFGRVAVRKDRRGEGLAQAMIREVLDRWGDQPMVIHSQEYIRPLYAPFGFEAVGEIYDEAGIDHRTMVRPAQ